MRRARTSVVVAILSLLSLPELAWGVVLDIQATGQVETVTLVVGETEVTTDASGRARVDVPPGPVVIRAKGDDYVQERWTVVVPPGGTSTTVPLTAIQPWMGQNPGGIFGGFGLAAGYDGRWYSDLTTTKDRGIVTNIFNGTVLGVEDVSRDPAEANRHSEVDFDMNTGFLDLAVALPRVALGSARLYPALMLMAAYADLELTFRDRETGERDRFGGDAILLGGGLEAVLVPWLDSPWFVALAFSYLTDVDSSAKRSEAVDLGPGVRLDETVDFDVDTLQVMARLGRTFWTRLALLNSVAPWLGLVYERTEVALEGRATATFDDVPGARNQFDFRTELETNEWRGAVGVDTHIKGPLFARLALSFNDADFGVLFKLIYGFGFVDP